jgi:DNA polymerase III delta prime subunit
MQNTFQPNLKNTTPRKFIPIVITGLNQNENNGNMSKTISNNQILEVSTKPELPIHKKIYDKLDYFHNSKKIPHIIFHGSSGSGKRRIVDNFIMKIYDSDKQKIKSNVMFVNCAHGKGIKFIREELKFFAKTNIQSNNGVIFKTIVLLNADYLTIDAQSALRRCIELFSYNTRFFIIVENKEKLLNPILSRFCEIYIPEYIENGEIRNLHQYMINQNYQINYSSIKEYINDRMENLVLENKNNKLTYSKLVEISTDFYEKAVSSLDLIEWVENTDNIDTLEKSTICMCFDKIKSEYRYEKLLILYLFDLIFFRSKIDLKSIMEM